MDKLMVGFIWDVAPEVILNFPYLRWYSAFWALGMFFALMTLSVIFKKEKVETALLDKLTLYLVLGIVIGARLGHILFYDPVHYWNNPIEILPIRLEPHFEFTGFLGLASHGGLIGALIALYFFERKYRLGYVWLLDRLVIGGALLGCFIRIGNFFNSEILGVASDVPWAIVFKRVDFIPRHPAQLYEAISYLVIFLLVYWIWKSKIVFKYRGLLIGLGLALIFSMRFFIEFVKENQVAFENNLVLNMGQWLSLPFVLVGLLLIGFSMKMKMK